MIRSINNDKYYEIFGSIIFNGIKNNIKLNSIEEYITKSRFVYELENGNDNFIYKNKSEKEIVDDVYNNLKIDYIKNNYIDISSSWVGEAYIRIFLKYKKTFKYIFSYIPLYKMFDCFGLYHEESFDSIISFFDSLCKKESILSLILKKRNITMRQLSLLTGISINIIMKYCTNNEYIYKTSMKNISLISNVLNIEEKIFYEDLNLVFDDSMYEFDKKDKIYRSFLGLLFIKYIKSDISNKSWEYLLKDNKFIYKDNEEIVVRCVEDKNNSYFVYDPHYNDLLINYAINMSKTLNNISNTTLILFDFNQNNEEIINVDKIKNLNFKNIYIINQFCIYNVYKNKTILIDDDAVASALIKKAKSDAFKYRLINRMKE